MSDRDPSYGSASGSDVPAAGEVSDPLAEVGANLARPDPGSEPNTADSTMQKGKDVAEAARQKSGMDAGKARGKASDVTAKAQEKSDQGIDKAASALGQAAELLRQQGEQRSGTVAPAVTMTAGKLDGASQYLKGKNRDQLLTDLEALVRQKPVASLLAAAGAGFLLSKIFGQVSVRPGERER